MDHRDVAFAIAARSACRRDGWTAERLVQFLECLMETGNVRRACERAELSRQSAYRLRRRDRVFALAWNVSLRVAHDAKVARLVARLPERTRRRLSNMSEPSTSWH